MLEALYAFFGRTPDALAFKMYLRKLDRYHDDAVQEAMGRATDDEERFPVFATLKGYLDQSQNSELAENAQRQARYVRHELAQMIRDPEFRDPITARVMTVHMPYEDFLGRDQADLDRFFGPQFVKLYREASKNPVESEKALKMPPNANRKKTALTDQERATADESKALVRLIELHNTMHFLKFPSCDFRGQDATGIYPHRTARPIFFHDPEFRKKLLEASESSRFSHECPRFSWDLDGPQRELLHDPQHSIRERVGRLIKKSKVST